MDADSEACFLRIVYKSVTHNEKERLTIPPQPPAPLPALQGRLDLIASCLLEACKSGDHLRSRDSVATAVALVGGGTDDHSALSVCVTAVALFYHPASRITVESQFSRLLYQIARCSEDRDGALVKSARSAYRILSTGATPEWMHGLMGAVEDAMTTYDSWTRKQSPDSASSASTAEAEREGCSRQDPHHHNRQHTHRHHPHPRHEQQNSRRKSQLSDTDRLRKNEFPLQRSYTR